MNVFPFQRLWFPIAAAAAMLCPAVTGGAEKPAHMSTVQPGLVLFTSPDAISTSRGIALRLQAPQPREVVFSFDAAWEGPESGYILLLRDGAEMRMYYRGGGETTEEVTCLAISRDGINWTRPALGLFEFNGSKENNIVWRAARKSYGESHNFAPFIDSNPACRPEERYKAVALGWNELGNDNRNRALLAMASPDGIRWKRMQDKPVITEGAGFDSQNIAFWDTVRGCYACYSRRGREGLRSIQVTTSADFLRWSPGTLLDFFTTQPDHLYTNAIQPYFREPSVYLGFPMRFVPERKQVGDPPRTTDGLSDGVFMSSHDGLRFDRTFMEAFIRPGPDPLNWGNAHGNQTPACGLLETAPGEISIYWTEHQGTPSPRLRRGTLRTDGFVSVNAPYSGGEFVTVPMHCAGGHIVLNFSTSAAGSLRVEAQDARGAPIPGFSLGECPPVWGDEIDRAVKWRSGAALPTGTQIRLRFVMNDADLYSVRFVE